SDFRAEKSAGDRVIRIAAKARRDTIFHRDQHGAGVRAIEGADRMSDFSRHFRIIAAEINMESRPLGETDSLTVAVLKARGTAQARQARTPAQALELLRQAHSPREVPETRIGAERIEPRIRQNPRVHPVLSKSFFEPLKCTIAVAESHVNH